MRGVWEDRKVVSGWVLAVLLLGLSCWSPNTSCFTILSLKSSPCLGSAQVVTVKKEGWLPHSPSFLSTLKSMYYTILSWLPDCLACREITFSEQAHLFLFCHALDPWPSTVVVRHMYLGYEYETLSLLSAISGLLSPLLLRDPAVVASPVRWAIPKYLSLY